MKLLLARHGQSEWQVRGEDAGEDAPLSTLGELQAHRLGAFLAKQYAIDLVFSSPLRRAYRTATIVDAYLKLGVHVEPDLREFDEWSAGWAPLPASKWDTAPATPELAPGYARFRRRVGSVLRHIVDGSARALPDAPDGQILIVAHGGTIGAILRILLGSDTPRLWASNASLHLVEWGHAKREGWVFHYLNNLEHLPQFMRTT